MSAATTHQSAAFLSRLFLNFPVHGDESIRGVDLVVYALRLRGRGRLPELFEGGIMEEAGALVMESAFDNFCEIAIMKPGYFRDRNIVVGLVFFSVGNLNLNSDFTLAIFKLRRRAHGLGLWMPC
jgi:hypothetical protein